MRQGSRASSGGGQGPDGQNYLASVSDLVSAFIFVFIILLAIFAYQLATTTEEQAEVTAELQAADEIRERILLAIRDRLERAGMRVEVLAEQGVLRLSENAINFPSGSEVPISDHHANVGRVARAIAEVVPCYVRGTQQAAAETGNGDGVPSFCQLPTGRSAYECETSQYPWLLETLLIEGHTDNVPVSPGRRFRDNLELSSMRAATVHRMIGSCEPTVGRLTNTEGHPILSTSGYGNTRPATEDLTRSDENRRIDLRFLLEPPPGIATGDGSNIRSEVRERTGERVP